MGGRGWRSGWRKLRETRQVEGWRTSELGGSRDMKAGKRGGSLHWEVTKEEGMPLRTC
jgi:hypothetical protein